MTAIATVATARALYASVVPFGPAVEGEDLVFDADVPVELLPLVRVLHTGLRAEYTGAGWYGCEGDTGRAYVLCLASPIPARVSLLCVAGDPRWDRIHPAARLDFPELFAFG